MFDYETDKYGIAWKVACFNNDPEALKKLIDDGLNVNMESEYKERLIHACVASRQNKTTECLELLIKAGADVNYTNETNVSALIYACERTNPTVKKYMKTNGVLRYVTLLVDAGADPHYIDEDGNGLLYHACFNCHFDVLDYLLGLGVKDVANKDGITAEDYCHDCARSKDYPDGNTIFGNNSRDRFIDKLQEVRRSSIKAKIWQGKLTCIVTFHESGIDAENEEEAKEKLKECLENELHRRADVQEYTLVSVEPDWFNIDRSGDD